MTGSYQLSPLAKADLHNIYRYGVETWGENHADNYIHALFEQFGKITSDPMRHPLVPDFGGDCRRCVFRSHAIYYKMIGNSVTIIGIIRSQVLSTYRQ